jgi:chromosome segregation protein
LAEVRSALAALPAPEPLASERDRAAAKAREAGATSETARTQIADAEASERAATTTRDAAQSARAAARAELAALESERTALTRATSRDGRDRLLDHVRAAPGHERALAAALGDDLDTPLAAWRGAKADEPAAADALATHVTAPPQLARRLAHVIVTEADDGRALAPGQRLVTRAGRLRRWDGFVAEGSGAAAAERLERLNRLAAIDLALPPTRAALAGAEADLADAERAIGVARDTARSARATLAAAETRAREAIARADRAAAALERLAGQRADLDTRVVRTASDRDEAKAEHDAAAAARAALPDGSDLATEVRRLQADAATAREAVASARATQASEARALAADRERRAAGDAEAKSWRARAGDAARRIAEADKRAGVLAAEREALADTPARLDARLACDTPALEAARFAADTAATGERDADAAARTAERHARDAAEALATARESRAGAAARAENHELRRIELGRVSGERFACPAPVLPTKAGFDSASIRGPQDESAAHERLTRDRERLGPVNLVAEQELAELESGALRAAAERAELGEAVAQLRGSIALLNREGRQRLRAAFEAVDAHFRRLFTTLFDGGQAHLAMIDSDDPLEAGLEILAQPPGKRLQSLTLLSGGEQALTATALIFALFLTNPAPICVLDEVDAPLDDANVERFCDLLARMSDETDTRYLIVTHNAVTMSRMHRLYGVTMIERGVSRLVSVDLGGAEHLLAAE